MVAILRKHYLAFAALGAFHFIFFFPVLFMGRVVSPNDVFYYYDPWGVYRPPSMVRVQNAVMNDPATGYLPMLALVRSGMASFHWNPYVASGIPGFASAAAASLTPLILIPILFTPLPWVYTGIIFLKINVAFWFAYAWLREERIGKRGAAIGAIVIAGAGVYAVRWLWQMTNATALYPALLWVVCRALKGKRTSIFVTTLIALSYALAGFPSAQAYGAYLCLAYAAATLTRRFAPPSPARGRGLGRAFVGVLLALLIATPAIVPFAQLIKRTGYLQMRADASAVHYPVSHFWSFVFPQRLGNHALKNWRGDPALGPLNNDYEAAIYVGVGTLALIALALITRKRGKWFWVGATLVILGAMFGAPVITPLMSRMPGFKYTILSRVVLLLPVAAGFLAATGARRLAKPLAIAAALFVAGDLALYAGKFHPYLTTADATLPETPVIRFMRADAQPFRFAGFLTYFWPNSAEMYRVQDIASHFSSEAAYRKLLQRIDPTSWTGTSTVIQFNSLKFNFSDPLLSLLGVRYLLEHRGIDIIKWTIFANTVPAVKESGAFTVSSGASAERSIPVGPEPFWSIELPVSIDQLHGAAPRLHVELHKGAARVWARDFTPGDITAMNKVYIPLKPYARAGDVVTLRVQPRGLRAGLLKADPSFYYGRVAIPIMFDRELADARIFRNVGELPRFWAVTQLRKLNEDEFIAARDVDYATTAVITDAPVFPSGPLATDADVRLARYEPAEQHIVTRASGPTFLASSEKLTPELRVTIDGKPARPIQINALFAGVNVPAGRHDVVYSRRVGRGWWPVSIIAAVIAIAIGVVEFRYAVQKPGAAPQVR